MSTTTKSIASVLNSLIETCKDGQQGFRAASENVENADLKALFSALSFERTRFVGELQSVVSHLGEDMEESGSVIGTMHRGWIDLKAAISSQNEFSILSECERGEDSAVAEYREALEHDELPTSVRELIQRQYVAVQAAHDRVRNLRDTCKE